MKRSHMLVLALLLLASVLISVTMIAAQEPASDGAVVRAGSGVILPPGGTVTLPVEAIGVQNLGAATVMVGYDPAVLSVAGCQRNPEFDLGMCNQEFDRDDDGVPDAVRFNVLSIEGLSATEEVPLNLTDITWAVVGEPCNITSTLEVEVLTFTDPDAIPISVSAENGQVTVGTNLTGDLDCDCDVDVADVMMVAGKWSCQLEEDECYDAHCDLNGDGDIDVVDIMLVVAHWGELCSP